MKGSEYTTEQANRLLDEEHLRAVPYKERDSNTEPHAQPFERYLIPRHLGFDLATHETLPFGCVQKHRIAMRSQRIHEHVI